MKDKQKIALTLDKIQEEGRYIVTKEELAHKTGLTSGALGAALFRQFQKDRLVKLRNGLFLILPLEHKAMGTIPVEWFIDDLMKFHQLPYYIGLLSAASYYGATHQAVQVTQIMTSRKLAPLHVGRLRVNFIQKKNLTEVSVQPLKTPTGPAKIATPEQTACDLMHYMKICGHLHHVATVIQELIPQLSKKPLDSLLKHQETSTVQRLGYILESLQAHQLTQGLEEYIQIKKPPYSGLRSDLPRKAPVISQKWRLYVNDTIEVDDL